jgi:hypothetical protein
MNRHIILLEDVLPHRGHCNRVVGGLLEAIETFKEGEEAVFEGCDVVCRVNAPLVESKQRTKLIIAESTPHHDGSSTPFQSGHQTVVLIPFLVCPVHPNCPCLFANLSLAFIEIDNPPPVINCPVFVFLTQLQSLALVFIIEEGLLDSDMLLDAKGRELATQSSFGPFVRRNIGDIFESLATILLGDAYKGPGFAFRKNLGVPRRRGDTIEAFDIVFFEGVHDGRVGAGSLGRDGRL